ncbi:MAG: alcohol dehydrogenase catalytic domain-containing protein [Negativicutes bacterium]|nr:alcohol dehydrogenase catalytic domain-containing protein [Negativicutes bacterium]
MLQAILQGAKTIEFVDIPVPEPGEGQVLIKVQRIGVCGSDIHVYHGKHKYATFPLVQGHEGAGVIVKTGPAVKDFANGDTVVFRPQQFCGKCLLCRQGRYNLCGEYKVIGVLGSTIGMASEYFLADAAKLHKLPTGMTADEGALVEPTAVAVHSVKLSGKIEGNTVLVIGAGPIGNLAAQAAKALGASKVMITDINPVRLELAAKCGIDYCVDTSKVELDQAILDNFGPDRAGVIIDCAAVPKILNQAIHSARRGTNVVLVGNYYDLVPVDLAIVQRREINLIGVMNYTAEDYEDSIRFMAEGKIKAKELISDHFSLKNYDDAYRYIDENGSTVMKVLIDVNE